MKISVIGTGYVGLVTGACLSEIGHTVTCMDIDTAKIARLRNGDIPIYEPGLTALAVKNAAAGRLSFTDEVTQLANPEVIFFAVPTPPARNGHADLTYLLRAARSVAPVLKRYTVLVNKSTVPVGTAARVRAAVTAKTTAAFDVVSNPEFLKEGFAIHDFMHADRIVLGTSSKKARAVMEELYRPLTDGGTYLIHMDEASAELTKYAANAFLATKISFMNEIANICERTGADVSKVREGIGSDGRIGRHFLQAGIGYGGSCFPKDVLALERTASSAGYDFAILQAVMAVNARQRTIMIEKIVRRMGADLHGKTFALWGLAFKADTDDIREAPALDIIRALVSRGAAVQAYDPEAMSNTKQHFPNEVTYSSSAAAALAGADALVVATEWKKFAAADPALLSRALAAKLVFDGRNIFDPAAMAKAGLTYVSIGRQDVTP